MADQGGNSTGTVMRDYRKGNWTVNETMILIEAKKMDDQRRMKRSGESEGRSKPAELRWKWVEDYCWRKGCLRSQNQCNDKWDNLMRDYKKVRDYERRLVADERGDRVDHNAGSSSSSSYWRIDKNERKEKNLPSNMLPQIYEALVEVVERKGGSTTPPSAAAHQRVVSGGLGHGSIPNIGYVVDRVETPLPPLLQHHNKSPVSVPALPPPPLPPPAPPQQPQQPHRAYPQPLPSLDSSPAKRRRRGGGEGRSGGRGRGTGTATSGSSGSIEAGFAISESAAIIAEAIQAGEEGEERRHKDLLGLLERRLKIEESNTEINRQGINGLVDAINKLANSIAALASDRTQTPPPH